MQMGEPPHQPTGGSTQPKPPRVTEWTILLILAGVVIGALLAEIAGFFIGGFVGYLLGRDIEYRRRLKGIEEAQAKRPRTATPDSALPPPPVEPPSSALPPPAPSRTGLSEQPAPKVSELTSAHAVYGNAVDTRVGEEPPAGVRARIETAIKTWVTTGNVPVKVGVLVSLVGLGLLIREADQRGIITVTVEMILIAVAIFGLAMLTLGWRLRGRRPIYGLSLQGGGVAVLYLTTYSAFAGYDILAPALALLAVVAITFGAGFLAVVQDSRSLAVLGIIGGFLAPVLAYSEPGDYVAVFTFYAILNAAILGVAWFKVWPELNLLGFGFTFGVTTFWLVSRHVEDDWPTTQPFIALFVIMYAAIPMLFAARKAPDVRELRDASWIAPLVLGTPFIGLGLQQALLGHTENGMSISALGLALLKGLAAVTTRRLGPQNRELAIAYASLAVVFAAIAVPFAFDTYFTSTAWVLQGALLLWIGSRQTQKLAIGAGALLQVLAGFSLAAHLGDSLPYPQDVQPIANEYFLGTGLIAVSGLLSGWLLATTKKRVGIHSVAAWIALVWASGWWLAAGLMEIDYHLSTTRLSASLIFAALSFGLAASLTYKVRWPDLIAMGALLLPTMAVALGVSLSLQSHPFGSYGWLAWPVAVAAHCALLHQHRGVFPKVEVGLHAGMYWVLAVLIGVEVYWQVDQATADVWPLVSALAATLLLVSAALWGRRILRWPLETHRRGYLLACAGPVLAALSVAVLVAIFISKGDPQPLYYLPLLNPLELFALLLLAVVLAWKKQAALEKDHPLTGLVKASWALPLAASGTALMTMSIVRTVHHWGDVPFDSESMFDSAALQASLSIAWALTGLSAMVVGVRLVRRLIWVAGASSMAVVVVKLFLIDLSNQDAVGRVVSFIAVGLLLLIVGYFAPVPPAQPASGPEE